MCKHINQVFLFSKSKSQHQNHPIQERLQQPEPVPNIVMYGIITKITSKKSRNNVYEEMKMTEDRITYF